MNLTNRWTKSLIKRFGVPRVRNMIAKQASLQKLADALQPTADSPDRFDIPIEMLKLMQSNPDFEMKQRFPIRRLLSAIRNIHESVDSITENPIAPRTEAPEGFVSDLKEYAASLGVYQVGFVKLPRSLIFRRFGVLYDNAIVLAMEMSKEKLDKAPSQETLDMVFATYDELGKAANKIASYLRSQGYGAQADHPLGGLVLFPPLAEKAGLGAIGKHGLLITREFGPRVRLAAVYTSIRNLPFNKQPQHRWIREYCDLCGRCQRECPPQAILESPVVNESGQVTHISQYQCFEYFGQYYGCSVCIKVCPFSRGAESYESLRDVVARKQLG